MSRWALHFKQKRFLHSSDIRVLNQQPFVKRTFRFIYWAKQNLQLFSCTCYLSSTRSSRKDEIFFSIVLLIRSLSTSKAAYCTWRHRYQCNPWMGLWWRMRSSWLGHWLQSDLHYWRQDCSDGYPGCKHHHGIAWTAHPRDQLPDWSDGFNCWWKKQLAFKYGEVNDKRQKWVTILWSFVVVVLIFQHFYLKVQESITFSLSKLFKKIEYFCQQTL